MLSRQELETIESRTKITAALTLVVLMIFSSLYGVTEIIAASEVDDNLNPVYGQSIQRNPAVQSTEQGGQGDWMAGEGVLSENIHEALRNMMWSDPGVG